MSVSRARRALATAGVFAAVVAIAAPVQAQEEGPDLLDTVEVFAGTGEDGYSGDGGDAREARIGSHDLSIDVTPEGTLYLADAHRVRKVDGQGLIDTVAGLNAEVHEPRSLAVGPDGSLYVGGDQGVYRRVKGKFHAVGGTGEKDFENGGDGGDGGPAAEAFLFDPDVAADAKGNVYARSASRIRKIDKTGTISTLAGGGPLRVTDAEGRKATSAHLDEDADGDHMAVTPDGTVYFTVADEPEVYRVDTAGKLTAVASPSTKRVEAVRGLDVDAAGNLYFAEVVGDDIDARTVIQKIDSNGTVSTVSTELQLEVSEYAGFAVGPKGEVYIAQHGHIQRVSRIAQGADSIPDEPAAPKPLPKRKSPFAGLAPGTVRTIAGTDPAPAEQQTAEHTPEPYLDDERGFRRIAAGPGSTLYYADTRHHRIVAITEGEPPEVVAGTGKTGGEGDDGPATKATLNSPTDVAVAEDGSLYIADYGNHVVRKVDPNGLITTVAGSGVNIKFDQPYVRSGDPATEAAIGVTGVAAGPDGSVYIADVDGRRVYHVNKQGKIRTIAGGGDRYNGEDDGVPAAEAYLDGPDAIAVDPNGDVLFIESYFGDRFLPAVRKIDTKGTLTTIAGRAGDESQIGGYSGDRGPATDAELNSPFDLAIGRDGTVYVADTLNSRVRAIDPDGRITTLAGTGKAVDSGDDGAPESAALNEPQSVAVGENGTVYALTADGGLVRKIDHGKISTFADLVDVESVLDFDDGKPATKVKVGRPTSVAVGPDDTVYLTDLALLGRVRSVSVDGTLDSPFARAGYAAGGASVVAVGPDGSVYAAEGGMSDAVVVRRSPDGTVATVAGNGEYAAKPPSPDGQPARSAHLGRPVDLAVSSQGVLYIATEKHVLRLTDTGTLDAVFKASSDEYRGIQGIAVDRAGLLYVADAGARRVIRVDSQGRPTTVAGTGEGFGRLSREDEGDQAIEVEVGEPSDVVVADDGTLYLASQELYRIDPADKTISQVAQEKPLSLSHDTKLAVDQHGNVYFTDSANHRVQVVVQPGQVETVSSFPWGLILTILGIGIAGFAGFGVYRWRRKPSDVVTPAA